MNTHTHTVNTYLGRHLCCGSQGAVGGSVPCSRVSPQSWYWGWRERLTFTPPTYNSCRPETWTHTFGYESDSLTIRPRLPLFCLLKKKLINLKARKPWPFNLIYIFKPLYSWHKVKYYNDNSVTTNIYDKKRQCMLSNLQTLTNQE